MKNVRTVRIRRLALGLSIGAISSLPVFASVWENRHEWSPEWESKYSEWVKTDWKLDIFTNRNSPFYGQKTDCADAGYTMRAAYSYLNGLPFAMKDPTGGRSTVSNSMTRWDALGLSNGQKFRQFMDYVHNLGDTTSISSDTYPVAIKREALPGGIFLQYKYHTYEVKDVRRNGTVLLTASTVPRDLRDLAQYENISSYMAPATKDGGFRYFRQPGDLFKPAWRLANFSEEQFSFPKESFAETVNQKLALVSESADEKLSRTFNALCTAAKARVEVVNTALTFRESIRNRCMDAVEYENYSTPGRDRKLLDQFAELDTVVSEIAQRGARVQNIRLLQVAQKVSLRSSSLNLASSLSACGIAYRPGVSIDLTELRSRLNRSALSSDPNQGLEARWGERAAVQTGCRLY